SALRLASSSCRATSIKLSSATRLATSPPAIPPMPSQITANPSRSTIPNASWFVRRTIPISVRPATSISSVLRRSSTPDRTAAAPTPSRSTFQAPPSIVTSSSPTSLLSVHEPALTRQGAPSSRAVSSRAKVGVERSSTVFQSQSAASQSPETMVNSLRMPAAEITVSKEDYLKAIIEAESEGHTVIPAFLAQWLGVSAPAVTKALRRLREDGYVNSSTDGPLKLTTKGREAAHRTALRHHLVERMLAEIFGMEWHQIHAEAERLEHVISPAFEAKLIERLGQEGECP